MQSDEKLVQLAEHGDEDALSELYRRYSGGLYVYFHSKLGSEEDSKDLVHEVFVKLIKKARRFNPKKASFRTWLYTVATNLYIDFLRKEKRYRFESIDNDDRSDDFDESLFLEDTERKFVFSILRRCIHSLGKERRKIAIILYYFEDFTYEEIGKILSVSTATAARQVKDAESMIEKCLQDNGVDDALVEEILRKNTR